jgi:glycine cleavage system H protein
VEIPADLQYTREHEWVRFDGDVATVGITDYAQSELGDIVFVELPSPGASVTEMQPFGVIEAVKAVSDLFSPVSGEVIERNDAATTEPSVINRSPYGDGWLVRVKVSGDKPADLLDAASYKTHTGAGAA